MFKEKGQKINRQKIEDILALTPLQEGMLFHYLREPDSDLYFEQLCLQISGVVDADIIKKAWNFVVASNEMLRTVFRWKKMKKPVQMVLKEHQVELRFFDLSRDEPEKNEKIKQKLSKEVYSTAEIKSEDRREKFDLEQVPFRVTLCKIAKDKYEMVISNHHILYDGWSNGIVLKEFFTAYDELSKGKVPVKPGKNKFKEYVRWVGDRDGSKQEKFWKKYLAEVETASEISLKRAGSRGISTTGNFNAKLGKNLREKLEELVKKNKITMPSLLYTAYGVLLQKYNNITDVIFGTTVSGRSAKIKDIENIVGLFINTLPLRVQTDSAEKTVDLIKKVNEAVQLREEYEATPLVAVKEYSNSGSAEPFDSIVVVENYPLDKALMQGQGPLSINGYSIFEMTNYDLTIALVLSEEIDINFIYNGQCFERKVIERLSVHFSNILEEIADDPGGEIGKIEILSSREKKQLLFEFNYRETGFSTAKTIPRLFARQVERIPENTALLGPVATGQKGTRSLTYRQLDEESNRLATYLFEKGVTGNHLVGILVGRTIEMITGILGILKSGSGYVPLNPKVPAGRNAYILEECGVELLLTTRSVYDEVETYRNLQVEIVFIEEGIRERQENRPVGDAYMPPEPNPPMHPETDLTLNSPENLAYVIFTSGSTGKPKGVSITHANFCALMHWGYAVMELGSQDRVVQNLSYYFDWSVWEIFIALTSGAVLYMVQEDVMLNPESYTDFMNSNRITTLHITPTQFQTLTHTGRELNSMKHLAIGAEKLTLDLVQRALTLVNENCRVYNMYGPTEATIMAAVLEIDKEKDGFYKKLSGIPIGPPIANTDFFILDKDMNPVPLFAVGELYIGGDGLSMGYLNKPELTNEKFIDNPYQEFPTHHSDLLYKTGDLACWLPDGTVEFLGRIDQQVKIRGFRIEPGEIENQLLQHEAVKEAFVMVRQHDNDDNYLCAYIVAKNSNSVEGNLVFPREEVSPESNLGARRTVLAKNAPGAVELQQYLSQSLPDYMIPTYFVDLEKMPLNPNGKIDIKSLPEPETVDKGREFIAPRDEAEEKLVKIWCDVLGLVRAKEISRQVGIDDNFFESGGHSLKAARLSALIYKEFDVEIPLSTIFKNPTIREISGYIRETERSEYSGLKPAKVKEYYPLSLAQKRLYVLQQLETNSRVYNMPAVLSVEGKINREKLEQAFKKLIARHESLRTSFTMIDEQPVQIIHKAEDIDFKIEDHEALSGVGERRAVPEPTPLLCPPDEVIDRFIRPFDLSQAPLLQAGLINIEPEKNILLVDMHHIISDGSSMALFIKEFISIYKGEELPRLVYQYKDYSRWVNSDKGEKAFKEQETFWLEQFSGTIPVLQLPLDYPRPAVRDFTGNRLYFEIGRKETAALKALALKENVTLYMLSLAIFNIFCARLSGQDDIVVGSPITGRKQFDLSNIIGMFVNMLALRSHPEGRKRFSDYLRELAKDTIAAFENQDYPFEQLVDKLPVNRDTGRNPLFDVAFAMQNIDIPPIEIPGLKLTPVVYHTGIAKFDLTFECEMVQEGDGSADGAAPVLRIMVEYCTALFMRETIERYMTYFREIVKEVLADNRVKIGEIEVVPAEEKRRILYDFNDTGEEYPADKTIHELFDQQVERTPESTAVVYAGEQLTYKQLDERANRLAYSLLKQGARPDGLVGIMVERSLEMAVGILGILKSGCGYVPLNPESPNSHNRFIMQECEVKILLTADQLGDFAGQVTGDGDPEASAEGLPEPDSTGPAYVIFTSGSTGKPKGVVITHANFSPLVHWGYRELGIGPGERAIRNLSYYFDWSVWEMFITLTTGAALYMVSKEVLLNPEICIDFITANEITILHVTPTQYQYIVARDRKLPTLRYLFIGAEKLTYDLVERSLASVSEKCRVFNMYGPTEATIISAVLEIDREGYREFKRLSGIPIGKPVANLRMFVLDNNCRLCPVNVAGELYIAGRGVASGYLNRPKLTKDSFISFASGQLFEKSWTKTFVDVGAGLAPARDSSVFDGQPQGLPLQLSNSSTHQLLYKTGDLVRWLPDGNIEFLGRIDHQVKIRGFRIEPGEIENRLLEHEGVKEAVVIDLTTSEGEKYLCAYIVAQNPDHVGANLRRFLAHNLPNYMIPSHFIFIDNIPLNPNGKVDRKALPVPDLSEGATGYTPPENGMQKKLVDIWSRVLDVLPASIGIDTNFFEIGGHSLKATLMAAKIHKELNASIKLVDIFKMPTIGELAHYIEAAAPEKFESISPAVEKTFYPLSAAQERMYILQQMDTDNTVYNIPVAMLVEGEINREKIAGAFEKLIDRHESLRTSFTIVDEQPVQIIHKAEDIDFKIEEHEEAQERKGIFHKSLWKIRIDAPRQPLSINQTLRTVETQNLASQYEESPTPDKSQLASSIIGCFIRPFDLSQAPLLRVGLIKLFTPLSTGNAVFHILVVDQHHIISDGHSMGIMIKEFISLLKGENLPPVTFQYKNYSEWLSARQGKKVLDRQEAFWLGEFAGEIPVLDLPTDFPRPAMQDFAGKHISFELSSEEIEALKALALQENATLYMVLLAVFNILLSKLSGQQDIIVGTPVVGRRHEDLSQILGMFVNTLALRNNPSGEKRFLDFIRETRDKASAAFENQEYPFEELVERVAVNRDMSRNPLFDVMLSRQDMDIAGIEIPGLKLVSLEYESNISKFDLTLQILEVEEKLRLSFEYCTKLFRERTILRYTNYFRKIVSTVITDPEMEIIGIEIISEEEKQDILNKYNNTRTAFTEDKTIHEIFAEQVAKNPHKTALVYENNHLSFEELNRKSNRPAQFLRSKGVLPDTIVGIIIERSLEMITGILGILKSGGAYMPVNPDYPGDRIRLILRDSGTRFLVTDRPEVEGIDFAGEVVHIGDEVSYPGTGNIKNLDIVNTPLDLVYVIYTSGSTGTPKGTLIEHRSVVNILENLEELYPLKEYGAYLLKTNYMFDVSVTELFGWIFGEGKLVILEAGKEGDSEVIAAVVRCGNVTHINFVPSMLKVFLDSLAEDKKGIPESLEYVLAAGEAFPESLAKRAALLGTAVRFENIYGPTEATIYTTGYSLDLREEIDKVPIGKPLHNTWNYIIDESLHLQALNISGELCIGGVGLARGYLNRPELTRDRFINNPFIKGERLYRTGDLTRWLPDGSIEYLGRMDHQVKIRGFRIELEEIENQLLSHEKVKEVVVTAGKLEDGDNYLCAYIVAKSAEPVGVPGTTELREYLSKHLPDHMIPSYFLQLAKIPLTPNGKTDRKALPEPEIKPGQDYVPPRDKIEEKLVETWSDGLGIGKDKIGIHANFFELGGHSLKAAVIVSKINKELNTTLTLKEFFSARSIKGLAEYLKVAANTGYDSIYPVEKKTHYELSSAQNRLYILQQIDSKDISYNMPLVFTIQGKLDRRKFENIMQRIINRHETLRTYFCETDGETAQKITGHINFRIEYEKIDQNNDIKNKIKDCIKPFDLSTPPLLRVALFELTEEKYIVLFDIHHIISDGSSMELLIDEFARLYEGESRPPLRVQYKDYAAWQNRIARGGKRKEQEAYWLKKLENFSFTRLPIDNFQSYNQVDGKQEPLIFDASTTKKIEKFCGRHNITKFVFLITVFQVVLSKEIDQVDITIGIPASIRSHFDLKHLLGIFLNVVLIRTIIDDNDTFLHHLSKSGDNILEALDNQDYPYEMLVSNMREHENSKENELFSILFNYFSQERSDSIRTGDIEIRPYSTDDISPKYDITLYVQDQSECTRMNLVYKANLYDEYTIRAVLDNFLHIVHSVLDNEEIKLSEIDSLGGVDTDDFDKDFEIYN